MEKKMKRLTQLNKDEITLLKLLSDAYMFANLSDVTDNEGAVSNLNYVSVDHENGLDHRLCSTVCNPIAKAIVNIIGQDLFDRWVNCSNLIVDDLINIIDTDIQNEKKSFSEKVFTDKELKELFYLSTEYSNNFDNDDHRYFYENKMRDIIEPKMINVNLEYEGEDLYSHVAVHGFMFHDLERILVACAEKKAWEYANNLNDYK